MTIKHYAFSIYEHTNSDSSDPNIGYWVCYQPSLDGIMAVASSVPTPVPAAQLTAAGAGGLNPFSTLAPAQTAVTALIAAVDASNALILSPGSSVSDTLVYGPVYV